MLQDDRFPVFIADIENCILLNPEPNFYFMRDTIHSQSMSSNHKM